jgi:hypothetical protein
MMNEQASQNAALPALEVKIPHRFVSRRGNRPFTTPEQRTDLRKICDQEYEDLQLRVVILPDDGIRGHDIKRHLYNALEIEDIKNGIDTLRMDEGPGIVGPGYKMHLDNLLSQLEEQLNAKDHCGFVMRSIGRLTYKILPYILNSSGPLF